MTSPNTLGISSVKAEAPHLPPGIFCELNFSDAITQTVPNSQGRATPRGFLSMVDINADSFKQMNLDMSQGLDGGDANADRPTALEFQGEPGVNGCPCFAPIPVGCDRAGYH